MNNTQQAQEVIDHKEILIYMLRKNEVSQNLINILGTWFEKTEKSIISATEQRMLDDKDLLEKLILHHGFHIGLGGETVFKSEGKDENGVDIIIQVIRKQDEAQ